MFHQVSQVAFLLYNLVPSPPLSQHPDLRLNLFRYHHRFRVNFRRLFHRLNLRFIPRCNPPDSPQDNHRIVRLEYLLVNRSLTQRVNLLAVLRLIHQLYRLACHRANQVRNPQLCRQLNLQLNLPKFLRNSQLTSLPRSPPLDPHDAPQNSLMRTLHLFLPLNQQVSPMRNRQDYLVRTLVRFRQLVHLPALPKNLTRFLRDNPPRNRHLFLADSRHHSRPRSPQIHRAVNPHPSLLVNPLLYRLKLPRRSLRYIQPKFQEASPLHNLHQTPLVSRRYDLLLSPQV